VSTDPFWAFAIECICSLFVQIYVPEMKKMCVYKKFIALLSLLDHQLDVIIQLVKN